MTVDTNTMISITEANQNFSKVARVVDEYGAAVILINYVPRYRVLSRIWKLMRYLPNDKIKQRAGRFTS